MLEGLFSSRSEWKKKTAVALSGGLDSVVLLHLLVRAGKRAGFVPEALHIHHGLSPRADDWADFCQNYCDMLGVGLETVKVCVEKNGLGIEAAARQKRYAAFAEKGFDILALAHHRDDQIETFMLAVARWRRFARFGGYARRPPFWGKRHHLAALAAFFAPRYMGLCPKTRFAEYRG